MGGPGRRSRASIAPWPSDGKHLGDAMMVLSPQFLIATASAFVGLGEHPADYAEGGLIDRMCRNSDVDLTTIEEGDTDERGQLGGGKTMRVARRLSESAGDRFLRWVDLDAAGKVVQLRARSEPIGNCVGWP